MAVRAGAAEQAAQVVSVEESVVVLVVSVELETVWEEQLGLVTV